MEPVAAYTRNAQLLRRAALLLAADRRHLIERHNVIVASAQVNRGLSTELRQEAVIVREQAELLRAASVRLRAQAMEQRQRSGWTGAEAAGWPRYPQRSLVGRD